MRNDSSVAPTARATPAGSDAAQKTQNGIWHLEGGLLAPESAAVLLPATSMCDPGPVPPSRVKSPEDSELGEGRLASEVHYRLAAVIAARRLATPFGEVRGRLPNGLGSDDLKGRGTEQL